MSKKVVTETVIQEGARMGAREIGYVSPRSPRRTTVKGKKKRSLFGRRKANVGDRGRRVTDRGLWREEWDNCPPSGPDCYYYVWNFTHDNYYCPEEDDLLYRGHYSKYEIDDFLNEIKTCDLHRGDKHPTGWYYFLGAFAILGMGLILYGIYLWYSTSDSIRFFFLVMAIILFIVAALLLICACMYCCRGKRHRYLRRREDIMPVVDSENRRIYHRGLNWRLSELGSYIALRTNYKGPVGGYRRRNPHEEDALLYGEDPHEGAMTRKSRKLGSKKTTVKTSRSRSPSRLSPARGTTTIVEERLASPRNARIVEEVTHVRGSDMDVNSVSRSGGASFNESNYNTAIDLNRPGMNRSNVSGNSFVGNSEASYKSGNSSPGKYKNSHLL